MNVPFSTYETTMEVVHYYMLVAPVQISLGVVEYRVTSTNLPGWLAPNLVVKPYDDSDALEVYIIGNDGTLPTPGLSYKPGNYWDACRSHRLARSIHDLTMCRFGTLSGTNRNVRLTVTVVPSHPEIVE
jgi:hypothetical protein